MTQVRERQGPKKIAPDLAKKRGFKKIFLKRVDSPLVSIMLLLQVKK
ncbi:MAG: hypothetical protein IJT59_04690 [Desulfovibrionaceae bacterium]|nr:hypothetical protein [Desulfovibrionaceae bacterium]